MHRGNSEGEKAFVIVLEEGAPCALLRGSLCLSKNIGLGWPWGPFSLKEPFLPPLSPASPPPFTCIPPPPLPHPGLPSSLPLHLVPPGSSTRRRWLATHSTTTTGSTTSSWRRARGTWRECARWVTADGGQQAGGAGDVERVFNVGTTSGDRQGGRQGAGDAMRVRGVGRSRARQLGAQAGPQPYCTCMSVLWPSCPRPYCTCMSVLWLSCLRAGPPLALYAYLSVPVCLHPLCSPPPNLHPARLRARHPLLPCLCTPHSQPGPHLALL